MLLLLVTDAFESDLDALEATGLQCDLDAVDAADVLMDEVAGNLDVLDVLFKPGLRDGHNPLFEVKRLRHWARCLQPFIGAIPLVRHSSMALTWGQPSPGCCRFRPPC